MSNIDDLKNDAKRPVTGFTPTISEEPVNKVTGFTPTLVQEDDPNEPKGRHGSIMQEMEAKKVSMVPEPDSKKPLKRRTAIRQDSGSGTRQAVDFSSLPADQHESDGVDIKRSPIDDILKGPDSPFAKYKRDKTKEMEEWIQERKEEAELNGTDLKMLDDNGNLVDYDPSLDPTNQGNYDEVDALKGMDETPMNIEDKNTTPIDLDIDSYGEDMNNSNDIEDDELQEEDPVDLVETHEDNTATTDTKEDTAEDIADTMNESNDKTKYVGFSDSPNGSDFNFSTDYVNDSSLATDDEEDEVEEESTSDDSIDEEQTELLKSLVTAKIKPISKKLNLSGFTVAKKGTISNNIFVNEKVPVAKWPLYYTGVTIKIKEIKGNNLEKIRYFIQNNNLTAAMQIIYDHIVSPKPKTLDLWMKSIAFDDYDSLFFAIYIAAFADSNYIPIDCTNDNCKGADGKGKTKTYITDSIPIMNMIKFKNKKVRAKFLKLYHEDPVEAKGLYTTEIIPISDRFAVGFVVPSIYSVMVATDYLDRDFINKHRNTVELLPYIDNFYKIDASTNTLIPIDWKTYANNNAKNMKSRILRYDKIMDTMDADEIAILTAYTRKLGERSEDIAYQIPETTCPYCGHVNQARDMDNASSLVFMRNQIGLLTTT